MTMVGIPYKDLGRSRKGCDCYGLVWLYYFEKLGIVLPTYIGGYHSADDTGAAAVFIALTKQAWRNVPRELVRTGDVVTLRVGRLVSHVGVMLDDQRFLHVLKGRNATIEDLDDMMWTNSFQGAYRWAN